MAQPPVIETERLRLVPFVARHLAERYVSWLNDPEVVRYSDQRHHQHTLASCRRYWRSFDGAPSYFWAIEARTATLDHIGNLTAMIDPPNGVAWVHMLIGSTEVWNQGLGTEAWRAACDHLLVKEGLRKIKAGTYENNDAMLTIMRKTGMSIDGRLAREIVFDGEEIDLVFASRYRN